MVPYLQVENLTKSFGDLVLFEDLSFTVGKEQRVGLIARNGTGKTTLMRIISGQDSPDSGSIIFTKDLRYGFLEQEPQLDVNATVLQNVFASNPKIAEAIAKYEAALTASAETDLQKAVEEMDRLEAWDYEVKAQQVLSKLGITDFTTRVSTLSGGQRKRIALASVLINEPDILVLDEPTNHLDLEMVEWLEEYLTKGKFTILMVTHDRFFLDRVCTDIIEIDQKQLYWYRGNYAYFTEKRQDRLDAKQSEVNRAINLLRTETEWMRRTPQARTTKSKYRIEAFYELREKAQQRTDKRSVGIHVGAARLGKKVLEVKHLKKAFGDKRILNDFTYTFNRFERLGIIGPNGAGKSTFLNLITGKIQPDSGVIEVGETIVYGYYRQEGMQIREDMKVIDVAREVAEVVTLGNGSTITASQFLTQFLFPPETQQSYVYKLSGGEKRRLYLLTILMRSPNFLILDEPTNDLDILTLNVLEDYLQSFDGVVLVVSHDRFFMDKVVDGLLVFEGDGEINGFPGSYTEYREWAREQEREEAKRVEASAPKADKKKPERVKERKLTFNERRELDTLTAEIDALETEKTTLEEELSSGNLSVTDITAKSQRIAQIMQLLESKGERWFELSELE
ncbi:Energy-dependent translational throttle protein EttA [anaerobic digester metagenome]